MLIVHLLLVLLFQVPQPVPSNTSSVLWFPKTPFESFDCLVDFTPVLGTDAFAINSVVASVETTGQDATSMIISKTYPPSILVGTDKVRFRVQGGLNGTVYRLGVRVVDSLNGSQYEGVMTMSVQQ